MNFIKRIRKAFGIFNHYYVKLNPSQFGYFGDRAAIGAPADLKCPKNIYMYEHARIGRRSTIMTMGDSKFIMKRESGAAEGLVVITSNHKQRIGEFRTGGNDDNAYRDIIVEEDVWLGINVTLLAGAHIGRGAICGAGCVVRKEIPPYAVVVGNPARIIKFKYSIDDIIRHEEALYSPEERIPREVLEKNYENFLENKDKFF